MSDWYESGSVPGQGSPGSSSVIRGEFSNIQSAMAKLPPLSEKPDYIVKVNAGGTALESISQSAFAALINGELFSINDAVNSGVTNVIDIKHTTSGTPSNGIGTGLTFTTETFPSNFEIGTAFESVTTDVTGGSEDFDLVIKLMAGGSLSELFRLKSTGRLNLASGGVFSINDASVLTATTLGSGVVNSSLTSLGTIASLQATEGTIPTLTVGTILTGPSGTWDDGGIDIASGDSFAIDGTDVLTEDTLGSGVVNSSLTSVGVISSGTWEGDEIHEDYLPKASLTALGIVEMATIAQTNSGASNELAVSPNTLSQWVGSTYIQTVGELPDLTVTGDITQNGSILDDTYVHQIAEVSVIAGTTDTLALSDLCMDLVYTSASAVTVTIPAATLPVGFQCTVTQSGTGQVTFTSTENLNGAGADVRIGAQKSSAWIMQYASNEWLIVGDVI